MALTDIWRKCVPEIVRGGDTISWCYIEISKLGPFAAINGEQGCCSGGCAGPVNLRTTLVQPVSYKQAS